MTAPATRPSPAVGEAPRTTRAAWWVRARLTPERRAALRRLTDPVAGPAGSVRGARCDDAVALTFDDGPGPWTGPVLDALAQAGATATFFVLVDRAEAEPDLVRRILYEGHEVGLHGADHRRLTTMAPAAVRHHLAEGRHRLERCTGSPVRRMRPPFGSQSPRTLLAARRCGLDVVVWTADADDWNDHDPSEVADLALARVEPGGVLLLHDGFAADPHAPPIPEPTFDRARAVELVLAGLADRGLRARSVADLLATARARRTAWFRP